ncbi:TIGR01777 family oxidoreductase [Solicola gregarius]|uniref:TIGR01777 family oxidoreductase n=1 Tax=Solicola gregarius TaxID=2908642 RepID=A0AA46YKF3_9ACTN|nr:TIGR01777 family oxidoreductase [Solicola gregarius]UYM05442.1 TIGR01777 family oxidoreductase [Solicola gregarius]
MKYVIGGASGQTGTALCRHLRSNGHDVVALVRRDPRGPNESRWDPYTGSVDAALIGSADVVVNLSGADPRRIPWTPAYKRRILDSRVSATRTLARAVAAATSKPAFLSASGSTIYGAERGPEVLTETSRTGSGFLCSVALHWEEEASIAADAGARVCLLRTTATLDRTGGLLQLMLPVFRLGLGARFGDGSQYFSCLSLRDWVAAVAWLAADDSAMGAYNLACPETPTNAELTRELARRLRRPAVLRAPGAPMRWVLGEQALAVLGSSRVRPARLLDSGFEFRDPDVAAILATALG